MLSLEKPDDFADNFQNYTEEVKQTVTANALQATLDKYVIGRRGVFGQENFYSLFTLTGAVQTTDLNMLGDAQSFFRSKKGRAFHKATNYDLHGPRYLAAIDPSLSIPQKLQIFLEDLHEGIECLRNVGEVTPDSQHKVIAPVLDYVKNSLITLTNAYLHSEKQGTANLEDPHYWEIRQLLIDAGCRATSYFYLALLGELDSLNLSDILPVAETVCDSLRKDYREYTLSSRDIVRPEASHPLVLLAFTAVLLDKFQNVDTVVGLPSGGTEIAYLVSSAFFRKRSVPCDLVLLPISLHSMLVQYGKKTDLEAVMPRYWRRYGQSLDHKNIIVVDDNSSSGTTVNEISSALRRMSSTSHIEVAVAEADIIRTQLDLNRFDKRTHYAHPSVYKHSVGVLPVSRSIWKKHDLKEVVEAFSMARYYAVIAHHSDTDLVEKIKAEVFCEEARNPFVRRVAEPEWLNEEKIERFQGTFLSNFHPVKIAWRSKTFLSVEHAYLFSKFDMKVLHHVPDDIRHQINAICGFAVDDIQNLFVSDISPKNIKRISNLLGQCGYVRDNWDEVRVGIMIELLLQKFSVAHLKLKLMDTGNKYLVEGNDWNDTFWGASIEGGKYRGRNILGMIIMKIRDHIVRGQGSQGRRVSS